MYAPSWMLYIVTPSISWEPCSACLRLRPAVLNLGFQLFLLLVVGLPAFVIPKNKGPVEGVLGVYLDMV